MAADTITAPQPIFSGGISWREAIGDEPTGVRDVDFYGFSVTAGTQMTIDIDAQSLPARSSLDSYVRVFDQSGRVIAWNDDSSNSVDSYLSLSNMSGGLYFVGVSGFGNSAYDPFRGNSGTWGSTGSYTLTVNLEAGVPPSPAPALTPAPTPAPGFQPPVFNSTFGWGVVDASAATASLIGRSGPFPTVPNLGGTSWANDMINAPEVWAQGYTGRGVVVAVVDTGVDYSHPDLRQNIWVNAREIPGDGRDNDGNGFVDDVRGWDFVGGDNNPMDDIDLRLLPNYRGELQQGNRGHGTHVAGTIAGANNGIGVTGVAYDARIMPVRVLDSRGSGSGTAIGRGIRYAVDNGAQIINLSLGGSYDATIDAAVRYASGRGAAVVIAAGNDGLSAPAFPATLATLPNVFSVGAVDRNGAIASFSNRAGANDRVKHVVAPGVSIQSTLPLAGAGRDRNPRTGALQNDNGYGSMSGTSMAAPHVAGVLALMRSTWTGTPNNTQRLYAGRITGTARQPAVSAVSQAFAILGSAAGEGVANVTLDTPTYRPRAARMQALRG
jgi:hypothetical protein